MLLILNTLAGPIKIELLDNPFIRKWLVQFNKMIQRYTTTAHKLPLPRYFNDLHTEFGRKEFDSQILKLKSTVEELRSLDVGFPYTIDVDFLKGATPLVQQCLNLLHRSFTNIDRTSWMEQLSFHSEGHEFVTDEETKKRILELMPRINDLVHDIEIRIPTERKLNLKSTDYDFLMVNIDFYQEDSFTLFTEDGMVEIDKDDYQYFSDNPTYDVWLGIDITGKSYTTAFFDHDDPAEWDITYPLGYTGKIEIDINSSRALITKSLEFQQWLKTHGIAYTPGMCGMPLGRVIEGKEIIRRIKKYKRFKCQLTTVV